VPLTEAMTAAAVAGGSNVKLQKPMATTRLCLPAGMRQLDANNPQDADSGGAGLGRTARHRLLNYLDET